MIKAYYKTSKILKDGREVGGRKKLSRSFLKQFLQGWSRFTNGPNDYIRRIYADTVTMDNANLKTNNSSGSQLYSIAGEGSAWNNRIPNGSGINSFTYYFDNYDRGIVIGNDDTPVTYIDYKLGNKINHGFGLAQMVYLGMFADITTTVANPNASWSFERLFLNDSSLDIVVKEIGVYCDTDNSNSGYKFCLIRDVITPVTVHDGEYFKVKYTLQVSV